MRIVHSTVPYTFSNLQVQFHAGHGHKHPFLVIEQGEHKLHTKTERLHGELATWEGEYTLQVESKTDGFGGTPFRIIVHEHHTVAPDHAIAEGTFVVTANIAGPQQVSVVLATKKGYQKGTAVFVLNIGNKTEVWGSPVNSPRMQSQGMFMSQGPLAGAAPVAYATAQPVMMQQTFAPPQQQMYISQASSSPVHSRVQSGSPPPQHSLLPQGRGSIVYGQGGYSQGIQQSTSSSGSFSSVQQGPPAGYPQRASSSPRVTQQVYSQAPPSPPPGPLASGGGPALGQQFFEYIEDRPVTKEVITYVQERRPIAKQYVVETRFTGQEHEVSGAAQQQIVGHQERIVSGPPPGVSGPPPTMAPQQMVVMQQQQQPAMNMVYAQQQQQQQPASPTKHHHGWSLFGHHKQQSSASNQSQRGIPAAMPAMQQMAGHAVGQQYFNVVEERPVVRQMVDYVQETHPVAKQYVTETRFTGQEYAMRGAGQQQIVGHEERIVGAPPVNFCNSDLCM